MINCIAIDDEPLALTQLTGYISRVPFLNLVASCQDAFDAMSVLSAQKIDLMFVDINMPDLNGMDFVRSLTEKPLVIFTTAYSEYAVEGFKVDALDYLLKPFGFQDFLKAVDKAYKWWEFRTKGHGTVAPPSTPSELSFNDGTLFVKSDYRVTRINLADIKYIEGMSEYVRIFVEGEAKPIMPLLSMKRLEETLPPSQFMRVHRSYIVNINSVDSFIGNMLFIGNCRIPISKSHKNEVLERLNLIGEV